MSDDIRFDAEVSNYESDQLLLIIIIGIIGIVN